MSIENIIYLVIGFIIGMLFMGISVWIFMPKLMLIEKESKYSFDETVERLTNAIKNQKWNVSHIYDMQKNIKSAGHEEMTPLKIVSLCQPDLAHEILQHDDYKNISAMMPCRIGVYTKKDGKVYISQMNVGLMSKMFGGIIEKVMKSASKQEDEMLKSILE